MGGRNVFTNFSASILSQKGQDTSFIQNNESDKKIFYPAVVVSIDDKAGLNRIKAKIVEISNNGEIIPGKDRNTADNDLPICIPLQTEFLHARPQVGECVIIMAENPSELSSVRFWIGPLISSQLKLLYESFQESKQSFYNKDSFNTLSNINGPNLQNQAKQSVILPAHSDIALQGREDADVVLKSREVLIRAGNFAPKSTTEINEDRPCRIQLKQVDYSPYTVGIKTADQKSTEEFKPYSQLNILATNINFISNEGKFREFDNNTEESKTNLRLKDFGDIATTLHPAVFGDELITLLRLILQYLLTHIHTPQNPPLTNNISSQLEPYLNSGKINDLISNVVRLC